MTIFAVLINEYGLRDLPSRYVGIETRGAVEHGLESRGFGYVPSRYVGIETRGAIEHGLESR